MQLDLDRLVGPAASALNDLDDSKKLPAVTRERLAQSVLASASAVVVRVASSARIDRSGLHITNLAVLRDAISLLPPTTQLAFADGFAIEDDLGFPVHQLIKGDQTSAAVAAAAIIAKTVRDQMMQHADVLTGGRWAFAEHVGYATPLHHQRIYEHGLSAWHRRSFSSSAYEGLVEPD